MLDALFHRLVTWLAPMLPFTMEEVWLTRFPGDDSSVHLQDFPATPRDWHDPRLAAKWEDIRRVRRTVTGALEVERRDKRIGASLEAAPVVHVADDALRAALASVDFADVCITSDLALERSPRPRRRLHPRRRPRRRGGAPTSPKAKSAPAAGRSSPTSAPTPTRASAPAATTRSAEARARRSAQRPRALPLRTLKLFRAPADCPARSSLLQSSNLIREGPMLRSAVLLTVLAVSLPPWPAFAAEGELRVTLVGTGGPEYFPDRQGIATLVEAGEAKLLFDVGRGTAQNLYLSEVNPKDITNIFLTHLHNDHYEGLTEILADPLVPARAGPRLRDVGPRRHRGDGRRACGRCSGTTSSIA